MSIRLTDPGKKDIPRLNRALSDFEKLRAEFEKLRHLTAKHQASLDEINKTREFTGVNNVTFSWTGTGSSTGTITWSAGSVQDRKGNYIPVPAGTRAGLTSETFYWSAWNPIHSVMAFDEDLSTLNQNPNNLVLSKIETGTDANSGTSGGGGSASGGWDINRQYYEFF